jgi:hypothetical protein
VMILKMIEDGKVNQSEASAAGAFRG